MRKRARASPAWAFGGAGSGCLVMLAVGACGESDLIWSDIGWEVVPLHLIRSNIAHKPHHVLLGIKWGPLYHTNWGPYKPEATIPCKPEANYTMQTRGQLYHAN